MNNYATDAECRDCGLVYGSRRWADFVIPDYYWKIISPDVHAILCVSCMIGRMKDADIYYVEGRFKSGPFADDGWVKPVIATCPHRKVFCAECSGVITRAENEVAGWPKWKQDVRATAIRALPEEEAK